MPLWRAAVLAVPLARRPEYEVCRVLDPDWCWREPLFAVVASALGVKAPKQDISRDGGDSDGGMDTASMDRDQLVAILAAPRIPVDDVTIE